MTGPANFKVKTPRDAAYLAFVRTHNCVVCGYPAASGQIEAHHIFTGGMAIKCSDYDTVPLCGAYARGCHGKADKSREVGEGFKDKARKMQTKWLELGHKIKS